METITIIIIGAVVGFIVVVVIPCIACCIICGWCCCRPKTPNHNTNVQIGGEVPQWHTSPGIYPHGRFPLSVAIFSTANLAEHIHTHALPQQHPQQSTLQTVSSNVSAFPDNQHQQQYFGPMSPSQGNFDASNLGFNNYRTPMRTDSINHNDIRRDRSSARRYVPLTEFQVRNEQRFYNKQRDPRNYLGQSNYDIYKKDSNIQGSGHSGQQSSYYY